MAPLICIFLWIHHMGLQFSSSWKAEQKLLQEEFPCELLSCTTWPPWTSMSRSCVNQCVWLKIWLTLTCSPNWRDKLQFSSSWKAEQELLQIGTPNCSWLTLMCSPNWRELCSHWHFLSIYILSFGVQLQIKVMTIKSHYYLMTNKSNLVTLRVLEYSFFKQFMATKWLWLLFICD